MLNVCSNNKDGIYSAVEQDGEAASEKGMDHFGLDFVEGGGGYSLGLLYGLSQVRIQTIPIEILQVEKQQIDLFT